MKRRLILSAAGLPLLVSTGAHASFLGAEIHLEYVSGDDAGNFDQPPFAVNDATVVAETDGTVEFADFLGGGPTFDVDVDAATITIDRFFGDRVASSEFSSIDFLGLVFSDPKNQITSILSVSIVPTAFGIAGATVSHDDDTIALNWAGQPFSSLSNVELAVTFVPTEEVPDGSIPEPATLVANGVSVLMLVSRRGRRSTSRL